MGAINYGNNDIINVGYNLKNYDSEEDYLFCEDCYEQVKFELERRHFYYLNVKLESGYYEGFYLDIEFRFLWLNDYKEKLEALKEATQLRKMLETCINDYDMTCYHAWWVNTWYDKKTSLKMVKNAIRDLKVFIKGLYTEHTLTQEKWRELVGIGGNN